MTRRYIIYYLPCYNALVERAALVIAALEMPSVCACLAGVYLHLQLCICMHYALRVLQQRYRRELSSKILTAIMSTLRFSKTNNIINYLFACKWVVYHKCFGALAYMLMLRHSNKCKYLLNNLIS